MFKPMDPKYTGVAMKALGHSSSSSDLSFPGRSPGDSGRSSVPTTDSRSSSRPPPAFPKVTDHLVEPEVSAIEIVRGRKILAMGSNPEHAKAHMRADFLISPHVIDTYEAATDMLTRVNEASNFATDVAVYKKGIDPATGVRYLEELSFEVVNKQSSRIPREKAEDLIERGVRRVFGIFVQKGFVAEWSQEKLDWQILPQDAQIADPLFIRPISVRALLDAATAEMEVASALLQKNNPVVKELTERVHEEGYKEGHKEGHKEGRQETERAVVLELLTEKFGPLAPEVVARVQAAPSSDVRRWIKAVLRAQAIDDVFAAA